MRRYENRADAQKKQYYNDRFFVPDLTPREAVKGGEFEQELANLAQNGVQILDAYVEFDQLVLYVSAEQNLAALKALKEAGYEQLSELAAVDFIATRAGCEVFYQLLSYSKNRRVRVKCFVPNGQMLQSVTQIYASANWSEREMYDLSGILIAGHPNLKRLIMPDDWHDHPLRKSYPLTGDEQAQWYEVDRIFGRERRDEIGAENRDPAFVDSKDTFEFGRIFHETGLGEVAPSEKFSQEYQEEGGVKFVKRALRNKSEILKERP